MREKRTEEFTTTMLSTFLDFVKVRLGLI